MLVTFMGQSVKEFLFATLQLLIDHLVCRPVAPDLVSPSPPPLPIPAPWLCLFLLAKSKAYRTQMPASYPASNTSGLRVQLRFTLASLFRQPISSSIFFCFFLFIFHLDKNKSLIQNSFFP